MKATELRDLSIDELKTREKELRAELFDMKVRHNTGVLESSSDLAKLRHDLARVLTVRTEVEKKLKGSK